MTQAAQSRVIVRPATLNRFTAAPVDSMQKRRVAAYARVSTDLEEQQTSYAAQVDYYTHHIKANAEWEFAGLYTDEGISATNTKKRDGFNRMIQDALDGRIDLIITKSVSRFARNTVDSLTTVRMLKEKGVEIYFEKENIYTLDSKGELLITIMSSLAQEESRSISENVAWGMHKRFADGKVAMPYKQFLGYCKGPDGVPAIVPEEAVTVRRIYQWFLEGKTLFTIKKMLLSQGIASPAGKKEWQTSTIRSILTNEKYKGDAVLQKTFCTDFLTKKMKKNEGELPQYYVSESHPAIVTAEMFGMVQEELRNRKKAGYHSGIGCFSGKIVCGSCGGFFGSKVWHSNDPYRRTIWQCNAKFKNSVKCKTPHVDEKAIQQAFLRATNQLIVDRKFILEDTEMIVSTLLDTKAMDQEIAALRGEIVELTEQNTVLITENAHEAQDQADYQKKHDELTNRYTVLEAQLRYTLEEREAKKAKGRRIQEFFLKLAQLEAPVSAFSEPMWAALVDHATVGEDGSITFTFRNGVTI